MGITDKLKFWEKEKLHLDEPKDDLGLDDPLQPKDDLGLDEPTEKTNHLGIEGNLDRNPMGESEEHEILMPPIHKPKPIKPHKPKSEHHTELILSKLDAIKANIENLNLRMAKLETQIEKQINKKSW